MRPSEQLEARRLLASFTASSVTELISDINAANAAGGANTINLAAGALFKVGAVDNNIDGPTGLPVIAAGNSLTVLGNGSTIDRSGGGGGTPAFRLFDVAAGASLALNNVTVSGGLSAGPAGGGIFNQGTLALDGVTVQNCAAQGQPGLSPGSGIGGGIYSAGALIASNSSIRNNQAIGGDGVGILGPVSGATGGPGAGGGVYVSGGTATFTNTTISSNLARGGVGGNGGNFPSPWGSKGRDSVPGGPGGDGSGGGMRVTSGTVTLRATTITANTATGGAGGTSPKSLPKGADGVGLGGGIYIGSSVSLDAFTLANTRGNSASSSGADIFGSFTIL